MSIATEVSWPADGWPILLICVDGDDLIRLAGLVDPADPDAPHCLDLTFDFSSVEAMERTLGVLEERFETPAAWIRAAYPSMLELMRVVSLGGVEKADAAWPPAWWAGWRDIVLAEGRDGGEMRDRRRGRKGSR